MRMSLAGMLVFSAFGDDHFGASLPLISRYSITNGVVP